MKKKEEIIFSRNYGIFYFFHFSLSFSNILSKKMKKIHTFFFYIMEKKNRLLNTHIKKINKQTKPNQ